ncbi:MAG TPA: hypothetical protein VLQ91_05235 [Draconibacterium sp.]|nr:hypothetical protein [Draconibacterium sp.]
MKKGFWILFLAVIPLALFAQRTNYDESKVPVFELPEPLRLFNGITVKNTEEWEKNRRPELLDYFAENVYGKIPGELKIVKAEMVEQGESYSGKAIRKQVKLTFENNGKSLSFHILIFLPKQVNKAPIFVGYNFYGNHTVTNDSNVIISEAWSQNRESWGIVNNKLTAQSRGVRTYRWSVEKMLEAGLGLATIFYCEVDPDRDDFSDGIHPLLYKPGQQVPEKNEWGSIAAWAWGLSRAMDYFETDPDIYASKVIVFGHSRLGKTALWAGATDQRFAAAISNNSGCGGAALSKRQFGETVYRVNNRFPYWFCKNFHQFNFNEDSLAADQHELIALIAPRPVYIASAELDHWSDQRGEFLAAFYATPVYKMYGKTGIPSDQMPGLNQPIQNTVAYHIRTGEHDVTGYDWEQYIKWAKEQLNIE